MKKLGEDALNNSFEKQWKFYLENTDVPNDAWIKELARSFFKEGKAQALKDVERVIKEVYRCGTPRLFYLLEEIKSQLSDKKVGEE